MKNRRKKGLAIIIALTLVLLLIAEALPLPQTVIESKAAGNIVINGIDIGYGYGSYFTKNGQSCANSYWSNGRCHHNGVCTEATDEHCNCMRYWPTGNPETAQVNLLSSQCYGFARYCQWRVYGHFDGQGGGYFKEYGQNISSVTADSIKNLLLGCMPATHVRLKGTHSICIISTSDSGVYYADCNTDGYCQVRDYNVTWAQLANIINDKSGIEYITTYKDGVIPAVPVIDNSGIVSGGDNTVIAPTTVTNDYIVHIDSPSGTYNGQGDIEISGWIATNKQITSVMVQSDALAAGQANLSGSMRDASDELNNAGYSSYTYKYRYNGVIPGSGLTANRTYSFSVWMDLATGGQTQVTTSSFTVRGSSGSSGGTVVTNPADVNCVVHIDAPTGTYTDNNVEISGWIASMKPIAACMVESAAIPTGQYNLTSSLTDASSELNGAGYGAFPYKYRYSGAIPKYGMKSNTDYEFKVWFNFSDGSSSGVTTSTFHTGTMKNTEIVITSPKGGSNYANTSNVPITGYILANSELWYILCQVGDNQYSLTGTDDATLAANNGYAHAYKFSKTIRCDSIPANSNPTLEVWTKTAADGVETHKQVKFTTGSRVYGSLDDYHSGIDSPNAGMTATGDFEVTGWIAAHAPIAYVIFQAVPTDGSGGIQVGMNIEPTSELDSGYSNYEYRIRYRGIVEFGKLKSNKTYTITIWCGLVDSSGNGNQKFIAGCDRTFKTNTVTTPVYTNTFNANGGSGAPAAVQKTWHVAITLPTQVPTRLGYTFLGWAFDKNAYEAKYIPGATFNEETSHTLYAVWENPTIIPADTKKTTQTVKIDFGGQKRAYKMIPDTSTRYRFTASGAVITVYNSSGTALGSGASVEVDLSASQTYYIAAGYGNTTSKGSFSMTVSRGYPVQFDANGGTGAPSGVFYQYYSEALTIPETVPERTLTVTLDANGGVVSNDTLVYSAEFLGWSSDDLTFAVDESYVYNAPTTLYAVWEFPEAGTLETPVREGYDLSYWVDNEFNVVDEDYIVDEDKTFYAIWTLKQYEITYDVNGGTGTVDPTYKIHGIDTTLTSELPERTSYVFRGWSENADATQPDYESGGIYSDNSSTVLYAVWAMPVTSFTLAENQLSVAIGGTVQLVPVYEPAGVTDQTVTWTSLKESVATVDSNGVVTGISEGTAMIKAVHEGTGITCYARITVTAPLALHLPSYLREIGVEAFQGDTAITAVYIGDHVTTIKARAFQNCTAMTDVYIPSTVTNIADDAFSGCSKLVIHCEEGSAAWEYAVLFGFDWEELNP